MENHNAISLAEQPGIRHVNRSMAIITTPFRSRAYSSYSTKFNDQIVDTHTQKTHATAAHRVENIGGSIFFFSLGVINKFDCINGLLLFELFWRASESFGVAPPWQDIVQKYEKITRF